MTEGYYSIGLTLQHYTGRWDFIESCGLLPKHDAFLLVSLLIEHSYIVQNDLQASVRYKWGGGANKLTYTIWLLTLHLIMNTQEHFMKLLEIIITGLDFNVL